MTLPTDNIDTSVFVFMDDDVIQQNLSITS